MLPLAPGWAPVGNLSDAEAEAYRFSGFAGGRRFTVG